MHHARISVGVALFIIAHAVFGADDQSAVGNPGIDNLEVPALDPFTQPTSLDPNFIVALAPENSASDDDTPNIFALDDVAPMEVNLGSVGTLGFPNSGVAEGVTTISDSRNCAENLGKREDSGLTICH